MLQKKKKTHLIYSNKINQKDRFPVESIIYLLLATYDSVYLHLFLWILHHFIIYIHKRSSFWRRCRGT